MLTDALIRNTLAAALLAACAAAAVQTWRLHGAHADVAECRAARLAEALAQQRLYDAAMQAAHATEARWATKMQETSDHAQDQLDRARADAAGAAADARGLRDAARAAARGGACAPAAAAAPGGAPAADAAGVLADVLGDMAAAGADLAAEADRRGIAGSACERAYSALTATASPPQSPAAMP